MIDLSNTTPFATGGNRYCFRHPDKPDLCLKVLRAHLIEAGPQHQPVTRYLPDRKRPDDNQREIAAHRQPAIRKLLAQGRQEAVWSHLPRFHGTAETSLGMANVSQLLVDRNGAPAETLEQYLERQGFDRTIEKAVDRFSDWLMDTGILTRNLLPHNLVVAERRGRAELFLVDGLGASVIHTKLAVFRRWRRRYLERRLKRFHLRIQWELGGRQGRWRDARKL